MCAMIVCPLQQLCVSPFAHLRVLGARESPGGGMVVVMGGSRGFVPCRCSGQTAVCTVMCACHVGVVYCHMIVSGHVSGDV